MRLHTDKESFSDLAVLTAADLGIPVSAFRQISDLFSELGE